MKNYKSNNFIMYVFNVKKVFVETPLLNASKKKCLIFAREKIKDFVPKFSLFYYILGKDGYYGIRKNN